MIIKEFDIYDRRFEFIPPFDLNFEPVAPEPGSVWYSYEKDEFNIAVYAYNEKALELELYEVFLFLWDEYAMAEDDILTPDAVELKNHILEVLREVL